MALPESDFTKNNAEAVKKEIDEYLNENAKKLIKLFEEESRGEQG